MGIRLQVDLETNRGPTNELFIRIDHFKINRTVAKIGFSTTLWLNKELADNALKRSANDPIQPSIGLVNPKVIYYPGLESEGLEATFQEFYEIPMVEKKEVEEDVFETIKVKKEVPYVSFDENGDEITLYRTVEADEKKKVRTEKTVKEVIDYSMINNLEEVCYNHVVKILSEVIPKDKIVKLD